MAVCRPSAWLLVLGLAACGRGGSDGAEKVGIFGVSVSSNVASPTADQVQSVVEQRYLPEIRRCHERALRAHTNLPLSVRVLYRIDATGASRLLTVNGDDSTFDECVEVLVGQWQFESPKDSNGNPTTAHVDLRLTL